LVIDDDPKVRVAVRRALEQEGFVVLEAADGEAGLQLYREHGAAIVVLDIFMPGKDGLEFIREVQADRRKAKIIAMSGGGQRRQMDMLKAAAAFGASRTFSKPVAIKKLLSAIHELLEDEVQTQGS